MLRKEVERHADIFNSPAKVRLQKLGNAAGKAFAERAFLLDKNNLLFKQNNEKTTRLSVRSTVIGNANVMTYDDIVEA